MLRTLLLVFATLLVVNLCMIGYQLPSAVSSLFEAHESMISENVVENDIGVVELIPTETEKQIDSIRSLGFSDASSDTHLGFTAKQHFEILNFGLDVLVKAVQRGGAVKQLTAPMYKVMPSKQSVARVSLLKQERQCEPAVVALIATRGGGTRLVEAVVHALVNVGIDHVVVLHDEPAKGQCDSVEADKATVDAMKPFVNAGLVTFIESEHPRFQEEHYNRVINSTLVQNYRWVIVIDDDEFIAMPKGHTCIAPLLDEYRKKDEMVGGVAMNWYLFFPTKHEPLNQNVSQPHTERFIHRCARDVNIKTAAFLPAITGWEVHEPKYREGYREVSVRGGEVKIGSKKYEKKESDDDMEDYLRIHHYRFKSVEEAILKMARGHSEEQKINLRMREFLTLMDKCSIEDRTLEHALPYELLR